MKIRKLIAMVLTLVIAVSVLGTWAMAADPTFRGGDVTAKAGDTITFPVYIENNPGIAGYMVQVDFSPEAFDLEAQAEDDFQNTIEVKRGDFTEDGNVVSNTTKYGAVVLYFNVQDVNTDGVAFNITLNVKKDAINGTHAVKIRYAENNTVDVAGNQIEFKTVDGSVTVSGGQDGTIDNDAVGPTSEELQMMEQGLLNESGNTPEEQAAIQEQFRNSVVEQCGSAVTAEGAGSDAAAGRSGAAGTVGGMKLSHLILIIVAAIVVIAAVLLIVLRAASRKKYAGVIDDEIDGGDETEEPDINEIMGWNKAEDDFNEVANSDSDYYDDDDDIDD